METTLLPNLTVYVVDHDQDLDSPEDDENVVEYTTVAGRKVWAHVHYTDRCETSFAMNIKQAVLAFKKKFAT